MILGQGNDGGSGLNSEHRLYLLRPHVHFASKTNSAHCWGAKYGYGPKQIISETGTLRSETFFFRTIVP